MKFYFIVIVMVLVDSYIFINPPFPIAVELEMVQFSILTREVPFTIITPP